jgi:hypothetical protein
MHIHRSPDRPDPGARTGPLGRLRDWLLEEPAGLTPDQRRLVADALRFAPHR